MSELVSEEFIIDTDAKAEWALNKIREARANRDKMIDWYNAKIKEITEQTDFDTFNLERLLSEYFRMTADVHKKTKATESYSLPSGKLAMKAQQPEFKRDDSKVIEWLKSHDGADYVRIEEKLDWAGLKARSAVIGGKLFDENGEEIAGVEVVEREPKFVVEVK